MIYERPYFISWRRGFSFEDRNRIREAYKRVMPDLIKGVRLSPYSVGIDWYQAFTPIEDLVWDAIRYLGLPLYPQFPVGPFFVDFGDPVRRIAIEVDSIAWHRDKEKDNQRQRRIEKMGWSVYRIPSWMTRKQREDFEVERDDFQQYDDKWNIDLGSRYRWSGDGKIIDFDRYCTESAEGFLREIYYSHEDQRWRRMVIYILGAKA